MGARMNYMVVTSSGLDVRSSHWGAASVLTELFWGPEHAVDYITAQRPAEYWYTEVWAEAVACVDLTRRLLLLAAWDPFESVPLRRIYLRMLAATWPGWTVRWADRGVFDVFDHVGLDPEPLRDRADMRVQRDPWWDIEDDEEATSVLSVRTASGALQLYAFCPGGDTIEDLLADGPLTTFGPNPRGRLAPAAFPDSGLHLDLPRHEAGWWSSSGLVCAADDPRWPGWTLTWWGDRYEEQLERTDGALVLPVPAEPNAVEAVVATLRSDDRIDTTALAAVLTEGLGDDVRLNPNFHDHRVVTPSPAERARLLERARAMFGCCSQNRQGGHDVETQEGAWWDEARIRLGYHRSPRHRCGDLLLPQRAGARRARSTSRTVGTEVPGAPVRDP